MQELSALPVSAFWFGSIPPEGGMHRVTLRMKTAQGRQLAMQLFQSREEVLAAFLAGL